MVDSKGQKLSKVACQAELVRLTRILNAKRTKKVAAEREKVRAYYVATYL